MFGSLDQNNVIDRKNQILLNMVQGMLTNSKLPISLWTKTLKMIVYILN